MPFFRVLDSAGEIASRSALRLRRLSQNHGDSRTSHRHQTPVLDLIGSVGAGALETLIRNHGEELWPDIERLARRNIRFRRALRSVWAYESPEYERRSQLLGELGEWWPIEVRFVVELTEWNAKFDIPTPDEVDGSEPVGDPPTGFATWHEWTAYRWPPSVS